MCLKLSSFLVAACLAVQPCYALTPLADPKSETSSLVRAGRLGEAILLLDSKIAGAVDPIQKSEFISSRIILHDIARDPKGFSQSSLKYLPSLVSATKSASENQKLYANDLLLAALANGDTMYQDKAAATEQTLQFERKSNAGTVSPGISYYKTIVKATVAYRFKETDFAYELLDRAHSLLENEDIEAPLTQLGLRYYVQMLTYQICDPRELGIVFSKLREKGFLQPENTVLLPHIKAELLGYMYDSGLLDKQARNFVLESLVRIATSVPKADGERIWRLLNEKEATELMIRWVSDDKSVDAYAEKLPWLHSEVPHLSMMAIGARVFYQVHSGKKVDLAELKKSLQTMEAFLSISNDGDLVHGAAKSISLVLKSLFHFKQGDQALEVAALEDYIASVLSRRQGQAVWIGYDINKDDLVQLTVSLYVSKRLSILKSDSAQLAELNHYIVQSLALQKNALQIQASGLYQSARGDIEIELVRGYLALRADRLRFIDRLLTDFLSIAKTLRREDNQLQRIGLNYGITEISQEIVRVRRRLLSRLNKPFVYFTRLEEMNFGDSVFYSTGSVSAYGVSISKSGATFRSKFWSESEIQDQTKLAQQILDRSLQLGLREKLNLTFWSNVFQGMHSPQSGSAVIFGSGSTYFGVPISIAQLPSGWLVDSLGIRIYPSARHAAISHQSSMDKSNQLFKNEFDVAFLGVGNPIVQSSTRIAAIDETERLIRGGNSEGTKSEELVLSPLPDTADELKAIAGRANGPTILALGEQATKQQLRRLDYSQIEVTSFATHGVMSYESGLSSPALLLTEVNNDPGSRFLTLDDINQLVGVSPLVLLSACNTASVDQAAHQAGLASSLMEGFLARGSKLVISSYWAVESDSTRQLMSDFSAMFFAEGQGQSAGQIFWKAVNTLKKQRNDYLDWGAFVPMGDYVRPHGDPSPKSLLAARLWVHDAAITPAIDDEVVSIVSSDRDNSGKVVTGLESLSLKSKKFINLQILEDAPIESSKVRAFRDSEQIVTWINSKSELRTRIYSSTTFKTKSECTFKLDGEKAIFDLVIQSNFVFLTVHRNNTHIRVIKLDPLGCSEQSIVFPALPNKLPVLTTVGLYDFVTNGPETLILSSLTDALYPAPPRADHLNRSTSCSYIGETAFVKLNWKELKGESGPHFLLGYILPEIVNTEDLASKRDVVYLRYSDTCDHRNYLMVGSSSELQKWAGDTKNRRIPIKTFYEVIERPSDLERSINENFSYLSSLRRVEPGQGYVAFSTPVVTISPSPFSAAEKIDFDEAAGMLRAASFYLIGKDGSLRRRIRSAVGCEGGFPFFSATDRTAIFGCRGRTAGGAFMSSSVHVYPLQ